MEQPRVFNLAGVPQDVRDRLTSGLPYAFAANRIRARGLGASIALGFLLLFATWFHKNDLGRSYGGNFYSPVAFTMGVILTWLMVLPFIAWWRNRGSLKRAPHQGTFLLGSNLIIATEHTMTVYPFAQIQTVNRAGPTITVQVMNQLFSFTFPDGRAFQVEQTIRGNAQALAAAWQQNDQQMAAVLDPFAFVAPHAPAKGRWHPALLAIPAALLALPVGYLIDRSADDKYFDRIYDKYDAESYIRQGGRHVAEVKLRMCKQELSTTEAPSKMTELVARCPEIAGDAKLKIDNLYVTTRAQLESIAAKARPVLLELLDASRTGPVSAKFVVNGPSPKDLKEIDAIVGRAKLADVVPLATSFDPTMLGKRETQIRDVIISAINALGPHETFNVVDDTKGMTGVTITLGYQLVPLVKGNDVIVYHETGGVVASNRRFLGLTLHLDLKIESRAGASYTVAIDAAPADYISNDAGLTSTASIYNKLVDSALAEITPKLKEKMFPDSAKATPAKLP